MYFYFYDSCTQKDEHASTLHAIEARLVELGINGRIEKLSIFKNAKDVVEDAIRKGAQTVIGVGNDETFTQLVNIAAPYDVTIGFIPLEDSPVYGALLGMVTGPESCDILSRRIKITTDVGQVNKNFFISSLDINSPTETSINCNGDFSIKSASDENEVRIINIDTTGKHAANYADGLLEVVVDAKQQKKKRRKKKNGGAEEQTKSIFPTDTIEITSALSEEVSCTVDDTFVINTPCTVGIVPNALQIIVGKDRTLLP